MTKEEFIKVLEEKGYSYEIEGDKIVVTDGDSYFGHVKLHLVITLPPNLEFRNNGSVDLPKLKSIPPGVEFNNGGAVIIRSIIPGWLSNWEGVIRGINTKRLLNLMIKRGMFI
jgi:hypothetical protein